MWKKAGDIEALLITEQLFKRLLKFTHEYRLGTSTYDHGNGVRREYSLRYCLQRNDATDSKPEKFYIKPGGRYPSQFHRPKREISELESETPTFSVMHQNILRKYPKEVLATYRYKGPSPVAKD